MSQIYLQYQNIENYYFIEILQLYGYYYFYFYKISMSNPFQDLVQDDDDEQFVQNQAQNKIKRTHQERKQHKKQVESTNQNSTTNNVNLGGEILPQRIREDAKMIRNKRAPQQIKGITEGHTHDRRSGTGRVDRPRKQGGGYGNVGNVKDDLHKEKYDKQNKQQTHEQVPQQEKKPEQPQKLTLAEYYQSKGINLTTATTEKKAPTKNEVNAEWIKKQKLTVMETKQDKKKRQQQEGKKKIVQQNNTKEVQQDATQLLGFGSKPVKQNKQAESHQHKKGHKGKAKIVLNQDDFPTL